MKFSNDSEQMMVAMMDHFEKFVKKKNAPQQRDFDRIMKNFYSELKAADKFTDKEWKSNKIKISLKEVRDFRSINHTTLLSSTYIPDNIKTYIKHNIKGVLSYKCKVAGRSININFYLMNESEFHQLVQFDKLV